MGKSNKSTKMAVGKVTFRTCHVLDAFLSGPPPLLLINLFF